MIKTIIYFVAVIAVGALIGGALGEVVGNTLPNGIIKDIMTKGINPGLTKPIVLDLYVLTLTFGFTFKINMMSVVGIVAAALLFKLILK